MGHDLFISYSQPDKATADAVCHRLEAAGVRCWIAPRDVSYGRNWGDSVVQAIGEAKVMVVIFSAAANSSRHVLNEVAAALNAGATVIPFRVEKVEPTGGMALHLTRVHWLDALTVPLDAHIDRLIESIGAILSPDHGHEQASVRPPSARPDRTSSGWRAWASV